MLEDVDKQELELVLRTTKSIEKELKDLKDKKEIMRFLEMFKGTVESELDNYE